MSSAACTSLNSACATSSAACFGATTLATFSYWSIAQTHLQRPSAAADALAALVGVKSALEVYVLRMVSMILGGMWSLS